MSIKGFLTTVLIASYLIPREGQFGLLFLCYDERILEQADRIMSRIDWTKGERKMYDERTRYLQAYSSFLATIEKEKKDARMEGKVHGIEHGKKMMIISLIKDGLLSKEEGAKRLSISVIELDEYLSAEE